VPYFHVPGQLLIDIPPPAGAKRAIKHTEDVVGLSYGGATFHALAFACRCARNDFAALPGEVAQGFQFNAVRSTVLLTILINPAANQTSWCFTRSQIPARFRSVSQSIIEKAN